MKTVMAMILMLISGTLHAQENFDGHTWEPPYSLAIPSGWTIERFLVPISFAPEISYKGVEDIRFAPGWSDTKSEEYWSYAFLWYLEGKVTLDAKTIENNLTYYYTGLIKINGAQIPKEKLIPVVTVFREVKKEKDDLGTFQGTIQMTDYMTQKAVTLNARVHVRSCAGENKTFVFYQLSPRAAAHKVWLSLDELWTSFKCKR